MAYILFPKEISLHDRVGGKAAALSALQGTDLPVPAWFVVTPEAFLASLPEEIAAAFPSVGRVELLHKVVPSAAVIADLEQAVAKLCPDGGYLAVRSSALEEDSSHHSFAGQLESYLGIERRSVAHYVAEVWHSAFTDKVLAYRRQSGLPAFARAPAVLVQRMVDAEVSGIAFAADPASGRRSTAVVAAVFGLASSLVAGDMEGDTFHVDGQGQITYRHIAEKSEAIWLAPALAAGVERRLLSSEAARQATLNDDQIREVVAMARQASRFFARPQDIEWAYAGGRLYLLQSRAITSLYAMADPDGQFNLWDNSNIVESYGGITTPLTYSFARSAYRDVYRQFCRLLGVPESLIQDNDTTFSRMIGLIRGRVYYNLLSWYTVLSMLPGFSINRRFMEQMMGVKEELPQALADQVIAINRRSPVIDAFYLARTCLGMASNYFALPYKIRHFYRRLDAALAPPGIPLENMRPDQLCAYYHLLERKLLTRWDAPLLNDLFAMIFHGLLRRLSASWCRDAKGTLHNDLLCGEGGMVSAEPAQRLKAMAKIAADDAGLVHILKQGSRGEIEAALASKPELLKLYRDYLERFGERCSGELKLESITIAEDPLALLRCLGELASKPVAAAQQLNAERRLREQAETAVAEALAYRPFRRRVFAWVLRNARGRVRDRENMRFERTRLFGRVRHIFVAFGRHFYALNVLDAPRDIFYLETGEILAFVEGTATTTNLRELAALRKTEFQQHQTAAEPASRFETRGVVYQGHDYCASIKPVNEANADTLTGLGCCAGTVRGRVRIVRDPVATRFSTGEILVAEFTDPGWILLFPAAAAIVVERGSLLSHSAIVAREMGIPAIVGVPNATHILRDGDWIEMDGANGTIRRLSSESSA